MFPHCFNVKTTICGVNDAFMKAVTGISALFFHHIAITL